jgi:hypothetical protein
MMQMQYLARNGGLEKNLLRFQSDVMSSQKPLPHAYSKSPVHLIIQIRAISSRHTLASLMFMF